MKTLFTKQQIAYMQLLGLNFNFNNLTDDNYADIEEVLGDRLQITGFDEKYEPTPEGILCECLLDTLFRQNELELNFTRKTF